MIFSSKIQMFFWCLSSEREEREGREHQTGKLPVARYRLPQRRRKERKIREAKNFQTPPSIIVDSGHGYHYYWLLDKPCGVTGEEVKLKLREYMQGLSANLKGDRTFDLCRILRVPGIKNLKDKDNPLPVRIIEINPELKYKLSDFDEFKVKEKPATGMTEDDFSRLLEGVKIGQRHSTATRLAGHFIDKGEPPATVLQTLKNWNAQNNPPLEDKELTRIVEDFAKKRVATKKEKPSKVKFNPRPYSNEVLANEWLKFDEYKRFWIYNKETGVWRDKAELILNSTLRKKILGDIIT